MTVTGMFKDENAASTAAGKLIADGFAKERISIVSAATPQIHEIVGAETSDVARGMLVGGLVGAAGGAVAGVALAGVFGAGLLAAGIAGALICGLGGAALGLLIGSATGHQVQAEYEYLLEQGGVLLGVHTDRAHAAAVHAALAAAGAEHVSDSLHRSHQQMPLAGSA
ncbi:MAG TPA: hypothetical protein VK348_02270 [Planctomycetota bacterium]|nr:hypothetical protein [Planctomycetota bacterium]